MANTNEGVQRFGWRDVSRTAFGRETERGNGGRAGVSSLKSDVAPPHFRIGGVMRNFFRFGRGAPTPHGRRRNPRGEGTPPASRN